MYWTREFFDDAYYTQFMKRTIGPKEIQLLRELIGVGKTVMDSCSGCGEVTQVLGQFCKSVVSVEFQEGYACRIPKSDKTEIYCTDIFKYLEDTDQHFDVFLNWNSSFGYWSRAENVYLLELAQKKSDNIVLEYLNIDYMDFKPLLEYTKGDIEVKRYSEIHNNVMHQHWVWTLGEETLKEQRTQMDLWTQKDFESVLPGCVIRGHRDFQTQPLPQSSRIICCTNNF